MNCIKCYQEIPEGSKFCPHCGAQQTAAPDTHENTQPDVTAEEAAPQAEAQTQTAEAQQEAAPVHTEEAPQAEAFAQPESQEAQDAGQAYQEAQDAGQAYQDAQNAGQAYQDQQYQSAPYQTPPVYQASYEPQKPVNWVPYLVLSIVATVCCCNILSIAFGIVAIVYSAKINSAVNAGQTEAALKAAKMAKIWIIVAFAVGVVVAAILALMAATGNLTYSGYYNYY